MDDTTPDVTVGYDDGWIAVTGALAVSMTEQLDCVRTSPAQQQYELEPGQLQVDPTGETPEFLTALDVKTQLPLSPQLREFYGYARWSSGSVTLLEVPDPADFLDLLTDPQVDLPGMLRSEFTSPGVLVDARGQAFIRPGARCSWSIRGPRRRTVAPTVSSMPRSIPGWGRSSPRTRGAGEQRGRCERRERRYRRHRGARGLGVRE